jgi:hypothetical protein
LESSQRKGRKIGGFLANNIVKDPFTEEFSQKSGTPTSLSKNLLLLSKSAKSKQNREKSLKVAYNSLKRPPEAVLSNFEHVGAL